MRVLQGWPVPLVLLAGVTLWRPCWRPRRRQQPPSSCGTWVSEHCLYVFTVCLSASIMLKKLLLYTDLYQGVSTPRRAHLSEHS